VPRLKKRLPKDLDDLLAGGDLDAMRAALERCEPDARGGNGLKPALAFDDCPDELARWLVARGADLEATDAWGCTPLHVRAGHPRGRIDVLLDLGADVHARATSGITPLHRAAAAKNLDAAALLVAHGADLHATDRLRDTPLEHALRRCTNLDVEPTLRMARLLLDAGARRTGTTAELVTEIGKRFEFFRDELAPQFRDPGSPALDELYVLFDVPPVPRRRVHDGAAPITVTATRWQDQHAELWDLLVPAQGPAATVQGEVVRISGRLGHEVLDNGAVNWDAAYTAMARAFVEHVTTGDPLPDAQAAALREAVDTLVATHDGDVALLAELAVAWVLRNPDPVPLPEPAYRR